MKTFALFLITLYQGIIVPILKQFLVTSDLCRYNPSCSEYTKHMIQRYGVFKGSSLGLLRISKCW